MTNIKMKLTKTLFAFAIISSLPSNAYADENINVEYEYNGDLITMINPSYWDYDYNTVIISTKNTNIRLTREEFEELLNTDKDNITIEDGSSKIIYNKQDLTNSSIVAKENYNPNNEIVKKILLDGGVTLAALISTGLCVYIERKQKKLTK